MIHAVVENGDLAEADEIIVPWWSFTKTLIAVAALALVRDGKLSLNDPIGGKPFSLRHLLQHRAGVPNYGGLAAYHHAVAANAEPWPVADFMAAVCSDRLTFEPGTGWDYSNVGYLLVRQMIEQAHGSTLDAALQMLMFAPLEISGPRVALTRDDLAHVAMGEAASYHPGWVYHGLVVGRLRDAALVLDRLLTRDLLPENLLREMCTAHPLGGSLEDRPWQTTGYGLGLMIGTGAAGDQVLGHTGGGPGSVIAVYRRPDINRTVAAFALDDRTGDVEALAFGHT
jgi:CubicO group peptidase (beta-lactamase class C family)